MEDAQEKTECLNGVLDAGNHLRQAVEDYMVAVVMANKTYGKPEVFAGLQSFVNRVVNEIVQNPPAIPQDTPE